jgi:nucleoid-associated protein YgaU
MSDAPKKPSIQPSARNARLAQALRTNLAKRKAALKDSPQSKEAKRDVPGGES